MSSNRRKRAPSTVSPLDWHVIITLVDTGLRAELTAENPQLEATERRYTDRHGNEQVMQTAKIGAARLAPNGEPPDEAAKLDRELASLSRWLIDRGWAIGYAPMPQTCYVEKGTIRFAFANREAKASELAALRNAKAHEEHANLDRATDDAVADAWESPPLMWCPRCHAEYEDHDGLGVLHCVACGYCTHPAATGDICDLCGADLRSATNGATEITDLAKRLVRSVDDIDGAKRFLKTDHLTIIERAASYTRLVAKALLELADKEP